MTRQFVRCALYAGALVLAASGATAAADVYKWVDERGVTNYSNTPPPSQHGGRSASMVEDRLSVYTPDPRVVRAMRDAHERPLIVPAPPAASFTRPPEPERRAHATPPAAYDPCFGSTDPYCWSYFHEPPPAVRGRHRPPRLVQPQLPAGAIAGNVHPDAYIPGQSAYAPARPPVREAPRPGAFTEKGTGR